MNKVNQTTIVNEIEIIAGVSKANAIKILNLFANVWTQDRIGLLSALEKGIVVETERKVTQTSKKKKSKKEEGKTEGTTLIGTVQVKASGKKKKKKKNKKSKKMIPTSGKSKKSKSKTA